MCSMRRVAIVVLLLAAPLAAQRAERPAQPFVPVGVAFDRVDDPDNRSDLEFVRRLRFNVIAVRDPASQEFRLETLARLLAPESDAPQRLPSTSEVEVVPVRSDASAADVRLRAWMAIARGVRGVIFDGWTALRQNSDALAAAASFADNVTRNAALFAPLQLRPPGDVRVDAAPSAIEAHFLESREALVFIAANLTASMQRVTMTFSREMPEAIWQNIEAGGTVNFVAGPEGPTYARTFTPHDVIVLVIRKQYR